MRLRLVSGTAPHSQELLVEDLLKPVTEFSLLGEISASSTFEYIINVERTVKQVQVFESFRESQTIWSALMGSQQNGKPISQISLDWYRCDTDIEIWNKVGMPEVSLSKENFYKIISPEFISFLLSILETLTIEINSIYFCQYFRAILEDKAEDGLDIIRQQTVLYGTNPAHTLIHFTTDTLSSDDILTCIDDNAFGLDAILDTHVASKIYAYLKDMFLCSNYGFQKILLNRMFNRLTQNIHIQPQLEHCRNLQWKLVLTLMKYAYCALEYEYHCPAVIRPEIRIEGGQLIEYVQRDSVHDETSGN